MQFFWKTVENVRKLRDIKLVTRRWNEKKKKKNRNEKAQILMNEPEPVYLGLSILDLCKTVMYKFWYDYIKPKYGENAKLCYMDKDSSIVHVKADDIYEDFAKDGETKFDTLNFEIEQPLPKGKKKKVMGVMKDELGGQIIKEFVALRTDEDKGRKKCVIKWKLKF